MRWYEATRHTFASRYVQAGGSLMKLASILGHSATEVTLRYAHLQPGNFTEQERALVDVELAPAKLMPMAGGGPPAAAPRPPAGRRRPRPNTSGRPAGRRQPPR